MTQTRYSTCVLFSNNLGIMSEVAECQKRQRHYKLKAQREHWLFDESFCKNKLQHHRHFPLYTLRKEKMWQYIHSHKSKVSWSHKITASLSASPLLLFKSSMGSTYYLKAKILEGWAPDNYYYGKKKPQTKITCKNHWGKEALQKRRNNGYQGEL